MASAAKSEAQVPADLPDEADTIDDLVHTLLSPQGHRGDRRSKK
jgi:hypothetical protein